MNIDNLSLTIDALFNDHRYDECLDLLNKHDQIVNQSSSLLCTKALLIQKIDDDTPLSEVLNCYQQALILEPNNSKALLEFGYFLLNVCGNTGAALDKNCIYLNS